MLSSSIGPTASTHTRRSIQRKAYFRKALLSSLVLLKLVNQCAIFCFAIEITARAENLSSGMIEQRIAYSWLVSFCWSNFQHRRQ